MTTPDAKNIPAPVDRDATLVVERMSIEDSIGVLLACSKLDPQQFRSEQSLKDNSALQKFEEAASVVAGAVILKQIQEEQVDPPYQGESSFSVTVWWDLDSNHFVEVQAVYQNPPTNPNGQVIDALGIIKETSPFNLSISLNDKLEPGYDLPHPRFRFGLDFPRTSQAPYNISIDAFWDYRPSDLRERKPSDRIDQQIQYNPNRAEAEYKLIHEISYVKSALNLYQTSKPRGWSTLVRGIRNASSYLLSGLDIITDNPQLPPASSVEGTITRRNTDA